MVWKRKIHGPKTTPLSLQARTYEKCSIFARTRTNDLSRGEREPSAIYNATREGSRLRPAISTRAVREEGAIGFRPTWTVPQVSSVVT